MKDYSVCVEEKEGGGRVYRMKQIIVCVMHVCVFVHECVCVCVCVCVHVCVHGCMGVIKFEPALLDVHH